MANFANGTGTFDATMYNGASLDSSPFAGNGDLSLNSASSQYVLTTTMFSTAAPALGSGITVAGWFYPSGAQNVGSTIFDISTATISVSLFYGTTSTLSGYFNGGIVNSSYTITTNTWHFFCYTIFCTSSYYATQTIYIDNPALVNTSQTSVNYVQVNSLGYNFIGYGTGNAGTTTYQYFNGKLDEFRLYKRVLTLPEINVLYNYNYSTNSIPSITVSPSYNPNTYFNLVQIDVSGIFSGINVVRTPAFSNNSTLTLSCASLYSSNGINWSYIDTTVLPDVAYTYKLTPYISTTLGSMVTMTTIYTTPIINGFFNTLAAGVLPINNTGSNVFTLSGWTVSTSPSNTCYLCAGNGTANSTIVYSGILPSLITYYLDIATVASSSTNISQYIGIYTNTTGTISFYAWPADGAYTTGCTLSVYLGGMTLLYNYSFTPGTAVPYVSFSLPFTMSTLGSYALTFVVNNRSASASSICIAGIQLRNPTVAGIGYKTVDPSMTQLYYPLDASFGTAGAQGQLYNYATGTEVYSTAKLYGNARIGSTNPTPIYGTGYLTLDGTAGTYVTMDTWTCPAASGSNGFSMAAWVYPTSITGNPTICYLSNGTASLSISLNTTGQIDFSFNNTAGSNYIINNFNLVPNRWYFVTVTAKYSTGNGIYNYFINDVSLGYFVAPWPNVTSSYTTNYLGGFPSGTTIAGNNGTLGNFTGNIEEFRVYNRTLTSQDVLSLWSSGYSTNQYSNLIDPSGLNLYFPFDQGTLLV
jgi:hypothetical protein